MGDDLPRRRRPGARLDAVRAGRALPARRRPPGGPAVRRRRARHVRLPALGLAARGSSSRSSSRRSARRATRARRRSRRSPTATGRGRRRGAVPRAPHRLPRDFLADFGFRTCARPAGSSSRRLELGGLQPVEEGTREKVLRGAGGVSARARAGAARVAARLRAARRALAARREQLGDLDRVQRRALAEVVAGEEESEPVLDVSSGRDGCVRRARRRSGASRPAGTRRAERRGVAEDRRSPPQRRAGPRSRPRAPPHGRPGPGRARMWR